MFEIVRKDDVYILKISGSINVSNSAKFESELETFLSSNRPKKVVLDFSNIENISSSGIRVIVNFYKRLKSYGGSVNIYNASSSIEKIFKLVEIDSILKNYSSLDEAIKNL